MNTHTFDEIKSELRITVFKNITPSEWLEDRDPEVEESALFFEYMAFCNTEDHMPILSLADMMDFLANEF